MTKLVWQMQGRAPLVFPLQKEQVSVGRDAGNDVRLPEPATSTRHARLVRTGSRFMLHDLGSSNGTWVNGERISSCELKHGDVVIFGRVALSFIVDGAPAASELVAAAPAVVPPPPDLPRLPEPATIDMPTLTPSNAGPPDLQELDRLLGSMKTFREQELDQQQQRQAELLTEWQATLSYATAMKARLAAESRIRFFDVSERRREIVLRVLRAEGQPVRLLSLTHGHPDRREKAADGIWMRASGQADRRYEKSAEAVRELVSVLALFLG